MARALAPGTTLYRLRQLPRSSYSVFAFHGVKLETGGHFSVAATPAWEKAMEWEAEQAITSAHVDDELYAILHLARPRIGSRGQPTIAIKRGSLVSDFGWRVEEFVEARSVYAEDVVDFEKLVHQQGQHPMGVGGLIRPALPWQCAWWAH